MSKEINASELDVNFKSEKTYDKLLYKNETYIFEEEDSAKYIPKSSGEEENLRALTFRNGKKFITIEYWDDNSIEYYAGSSATKDVFSNIPSSSSTANQINSTNFNFPTFKTLSYIGLGGLFLFFL